MEKFRTEEAERQKALEALQGFEVDESPKKENVVHKRRPSNTGFSLEKEMEKFRAEELEKQKNALKEMLAEGVISNKQYNNALGVQRELANQKQIELEYLFYLLH
jgi:transcription termination factor NusB